MLSSEELLRFHDLRDCHLVKSFCEAAIFTQLWLARRPKNAAVC